MRCMTAQVQASWIIDNSGQFSPFHISTIFLKKYPRSTITQTYRDDLQCQNCDCLSLEKHVDSLIIPFNQEIATLYRLLVNCNGIATLF